VDPNCADTGFPMMPLNQSPANQDLAARQAIPSVFTVILLAIWLAASPAGVSAHGSKKDKMAAMDPACMADMNGVDMSAMGPSMAAMMCHMYVTPLRPPQPGDDQKAKAVVASVKAAIEKYKDYKKAIADGYIQGNPEVKQTQYHFTNDAYARIADQQFDPSKPTSLLYISTPTEHFKLEGVMFTARPNSTLDELNQRVPLSVAHWHMHINFCGAPADKVKEYLGDHPKFGMFGSIHTKAACDAEGGTFMPTVFTWMIHIFPYEDDPAQVFSMNDDLPHVH
jgi:hypothetical protein